VARSVPINDIRDLGHEDPMAELVRALLGASEDVVVETVQCLEQSDIFFVSIADRSLVIKVVDLRTLRQRTTKPDEKWLITSRSVENEAVFWTNTDADLLKERGLVLPRVQAVEKPPKSLKDSPAFLREARWCIATERLHKKQWSQRQVASFEEATFALKAMAAFHACCWDEVLINGCSPTLNEVHLCDGGGDGGRLFEWGGWWRRELRPTVKFERTEDIYREMAASFPSVFSSQDVEKNAALLRTLSERRSLDYLERQLRPKAGPHVASKTLGARCLIHGDFKLSNVFFLNEGYSVAEAGGEVALIDFQWTGWANSGCGDLAYFLFGAIPAYMLEKEGQELRSFYYAALTAKLWERRNESDPGVREEGWPSFSREDFERAWRLEVLDYCKTAIPQLMAGINETVAKENETKYGFLCHEWEPRMMAVMCDICCQYIESELIPHV
jgi:Ecdysteroid kinase-like family